MHGNDRVERLTNSPILLTTMALVRRNIGRLPQRRVELYPKTIEVLMHWRSAVDPAMDEREAMPQLAHLAYEICARGVPRLDEPAVLANFQAMRQEFPYLEDIRQKTPAAFLRQVEARTALLIQAGHERLAGQTVPIYEFRHLSFQEYLAAWAIVHGFEPGFKAGRNLPALIGDLAGRGGGRQQGG
jgi:predicted NACHT family NTPase